MAPQPSSLRTSFRALSITRIETKESVIYRGSRQDNLTPYTACRCGFTLSEILPATQGLHLSLSDSRGCGLARGGIQPDSKQLKRSHRDALLGSYPRGITLYNAPDLREHVQNAVSVETARGIRLSKQKTSNKIDGALRGSRA